MARLNDWNRKYWRNASGEREYNPDDIEVEDVTLAVYENSNGDTIEYRHPAEEEAEHKYEVLLNGELVEDIILEGENFDEEEFEELTFGTRRSAREAASDLMRMLPKLEADEDGNYDYDSLQSWAKVTGVAANGSREDLQEAIVQ